MVHDISHPGFNNNFQIATQSNLALLYNDISVLEMFHCTTAFEAMYSEECNIVEKLTDSQHKDFRLGMVKMVLATDMSKHFDLLGKFKVKLEGNGTYFPLTFACTHTNGCLRSGHDVERRQAAIVAGCYEVCGHQQSREVHRTMPAVGLSYHGGIFPPGL